MARRKVRQNEDESEIDLTPMLDVVFIMLIFFIVTASFIRESGLDVQRPDNTQNEPDSDSPSIVISVTATGEIWVGDRRVDSRAVRANIERLRAESPEAAVVVRANNKAKNEVFAGVIDSAYQAGAASVSLVTTES